MGVEPHAKIKQKFLDDKKFSTYKSFHHDFSTE